MSLPAPVPSRLWGDIVGGVEEHESERMRSAEFLCGAILFFVKVITG